MKSIFVILIAICVISSVNAANLRSRVYYERAFEQYRRSLNKDYSTADEYIYRLNIFANNLDTIEKHNKLSKSWKMGVNKFADISPEEFVASKLHLGEQGKASLKKSPVRYLRNRAPEAVDWTTKGVVADVKDQRSCGSCYAFSGLAAIESIFAINTTILQTLSVQQIVDCSNDYGNYGCGGGLRDCVMDYVIDRGICLEKDYPYVADEGACQKTCEPVTYAKLAGHYTIEPQEDQLEKVIAIQPPSVGIDGSGIQFYKSGIFADEVCGSSGINHGVLAVGYGEEDGVKYFKIQNSWGADWGESGYVRFARNVREGGLCRVAERVHVPTM